jgi:hypothetical protein
MGGGVWKDHISRLTLTKSLQDLFQPMSGYGGTHLSSQLHWRNTNQKIVSQAGPVIIKWEPISKLTNTEITGGVAQVVEHLVSKYKALSSNIISTIKEKDTHKIKINK